MTSLDLKRQLNAANARKWELRRKLALMKLENVRLRLANAAWRLFLLPGYLMDLPPEHPHRFYAAQVILYVGVFGIIAAVVLKRIQGGAP